MKAEAIFIINSVIYNTNKTAMKFFPVLCKMQWLLLYVSPKMLGPQQQPQSQLQTYGPKKCFK